MNTKHQHTPGPWILETVPTSSGSVHKIGPFPSAGVYSQTHACLYADGQRIGIDDNNSIAAELRANARLISASPDLLAALTEIMDAPSAGAEDEIVIIITPELAARAADAIRKATTTPEAPAQINKLED